MIDVFDPTLAPIGDPVTIIKGSYVSWRKAIDLDPALYGLKYTFIPQAGGIAQVANGAATGDYWSFFITGTTSLTWAEGKYGFDVAVVRLSDSEAAVIASGVTDVFASTSDRRSHAQIMVAKIESIMQGKADSDVDSYTIAGRSISKLSPGELMKWRDYYRSEAGSTANGGKAVHKVKARFIS